MSESEQLIGIIQDFHKKIDAGFSDLRDHMDEGITSLRREINGRIEKVTVKAEATEKKVAKIHGWAAGASFVGGLIGMVIGWAISLFKH